ncbi:unnamed protein product [Mytilus edulis]|uniref:Reverse transcriptase RNase H-like domain-containing protein n=1 Tax=Mytilus edulis TaxID=6550 RepID=A0A8S3QYC6_MYTED|nr:unnamed protein product [Mytilus edulis]
MQGLGAVLSQFVDGKLRVVAYASRALRPNERNMDNYSSRKLELLALTWAITEKFRDYLLGSKFTVFTDNNPLCYLQTSKLSAHEQRWLSKLAVFNFEVKYRQAKHNNNADALSRMHDKIELSKSEDVKNLLQTFAAGTVVPNDLASNIQSVSRKSVYTEGAFVTIPTLDRQEIKDLQERDTVVGKFIEIWDTKRKPLRSEQRKFDRPLVTLLRQWDRIEVVDSLVYRTDETDQSLDEWIIAHQNRLRYAYEKAGEQTKDRAEYRKTKHDEKRFNPEICVDDKVYIRNRGVHGRNKIQGTWSSTVYRVVRLSEITATVEPNDGAGVSRTLNRDVIKCNIQQYVDDNSSESDSSDDMFIPRRTTRTTAGKHTNPNRLPNSIFSK